MKIKKHLNFSSLREKLSEVFSLIPEWRQKNKINYSIHDALMSGFACMYFQDPSLLQFQKRMQEEQHRNNLTTLFKVGDIPKETQMREIIDEIDSEHLRPVFNNYYSRIQRGKYLEGYQALPGLYYFPIDGSQFYSSKEVCCGQCLTKEHTEGSKTYSHQVLQGGIMHPDKKEIIPFMPEQICNEDGSTKQDCEMNAAKRLVVKLRKEFPRLGLIIGGDALFSRQPIIEDVLANRMHYIFGAKPTDHKYLMEWIEAYEQLNELRFIDTKGRTHIYEWMNEVPLSGRKDAVMVNYINCRIIGKNKQGKEKTLYRNSWVTNLAITKANIKTLVKTGRCRWKNENECFNVMKNHGYYMEHNYGHGKKNLCYNFYLLTLLAFYFHQIFELTDKQYQACRNKFGSKKHLWEKLRAYIDILIFDTWEILLDFALKPK
ncbi:MAG: hypothetical protein KAT71_04495, partial [Gammaproteobacteria bacterium]|nr:hypothetical protein [Gammaproteobacteria bacterium]